MKRVMIVEDDRDLGEMLQLHLRAAGYDPVHFENGGAAWRYLEAGGKVDLAVLDLNLPGMSGLELCQRIRREARLRDLPILMLTVRSEVEDQVEGYDTGVDDYLPKPLEPAILIARLKALERRTSRIPS